MGGWTIRSLQIPVELPLQRAKQGRVENPETAGKQTMHSVGLKHMWQSYTGMRRTA